MTYQENHGHKYARLFRKVRGVRMTSPDIAAEYDPVANIVYINADIYDDLAEHERRKLYRFSTFEQ